MSFFENFTEKAKLYANIAAEKAKDVAEVAADKAKDVKETAQLTLAIRSEQRELDKNFRAIGQWFASEYQGETPDAIKDVMAPMIKCPRCMSAPSAAPPPTPASAPSAALRWFLPRQHLLPRNLPRAKISSSRRSNPTHIR